MTILDQAELTFNQGRWGWRADVLMIKKKLWFQNGTQTPMKSEINHDTLGFKHRQFAKILKYIGFYTSQNGIKHDQNIKL